MCVGVYRGVHVWVTFSQDFSLIFIIILEERYDFIFLERINRFRFTINICARYLSSLVEYCF